MKLGVIFEAIRPSGAKYRLAIVCSVPLTVVPTGIALAQLL